MAQVSRRQLLKLVGAAGGVRVFSGSSVYADDAVIMKPSFFDLLFGTRPFGLLAGNASAFNHPTLEGVHHDKEGNLVLPPERVDYMNTNKVGYGERLTNLVEFKGKLDHFIDLTHKYRISIALQRWVDKVPTFAKVMAACGGSAALAELVPAIEKVAGTVGLALFVEDQAVAALERYRQIANALTVQEILKKDTRGFIAHGLKIIDHNVVQEFLDFQAYDGAPGTRIWQMTYKA